MPGARTSAPSTRHVRDGAHAIADRQRFDLCIVGSGPAGLAAASSAHQNGIDYVVLERTPQVADTIFCYQARKLVLRHLVSTFAPGEVEALDADVRKLSTLVAAVDELYRTIDRGRFPDEYDRDAFADGLGRLEESLR